jgi:hypothetical protein
VAIFLATWLISAVLYRARGYDNLQISTP